MIDLIVGGVVVIGAGLAVWKTWKDKKERAAAAGVAAAARVPVMQSLERRMGRSRNALAKGAGGVRRRLLSLRRELPAVLLLFCAELRRCRSCP